MEKANLLNTQLTETKITAELNHKLMMPKHIREQNSSQNPKHDQMKENTSSHHEAKISLLNIKFMIQTHRRTEIKPKAQK